MVYTFYNVYNRVQQEKNTQNTQNVFFRIFFNASVLSGTFPSLRRILVRPVWGRKTPAQTMKMRTVCKHCCSSDSRNQIFLHDRPWKWPWIKSMSNEYDTAVRVRESQLLRRVMYLWRHQQQWATRSIHYSMSTSYPFNKRPGSQVELTGFMWA